MSDDDSSFESKNDVLPDEVLLRVFALLGQQDLLLAARPVCRRWRRLALDSSLWRDYDILAQAWTQQGTLSRLSRSKLTARAALRVLLYASRLRLVGLAEADVELWEEASTTHCAVETLVMSFVNEMVSTGDRSVRVVQRQLDLGRMSSLQLNMAPRPIAEKLVDLLIDAKLEKLDILLQNDVEHSVPLQGTMPEPVAPLDDLSPELPAEDGAAEFVPARLTAGPSGDVDDHPEEDPDEDSHSAAGPSSSPRASVQWLEFSSFSEDPLLDRLLRQHASTLRHVTFYCRGAETTTQHGGPLEHSHDKPLRLLAKCPQLQSLKLFVDVLVASPALLYYFGGAACQLTKLDVTQSVSRSVVAAAVRALAASGRAVVRELCIPDLPDGRVLKGLPLLHTLTVNSFPDADVLEAITPQIAPNLRLMNTGVTCWSRCRVPDANRLVRRNPQLHLWRLTKRHYCTRRDSTGCDCCRHRQHKLYGRVLEPLVLAMATELSKLRPDKCLTNTYGLFGHMPNEHCDLEAHEKRANGMVLWVCATPGAAC